MFIDQKEIQGPRGGTAYMQYGIASAGAVVAVRPDGYVGTVAPLDEVAHLEEYFGRFMQRT